MSTAELDCGLESRRDALLADTRWNGIDYVEVADDQLSLTVYFFAPPKGITAQNWWAVTTLKYNAYRKIESDLADKAVNEASRAAPMPSKELPTSIAESIRKMRARPTV